MYSNSATRILQPALAKTEEGPDWYLWESPRFRAQVLVPSAPSDSRAGSRMWGCSEWLIWYCLWKVPARKPLSGLLSEKVEVTISVGTTTLWSRLAIWGNIPLHWGADPVPSILLGDNKSTWLGTWVRANRYWAISSRLTSFYVCHLCYLL